MASETKSGKIQRFFARVRPYISLLVSCTFFCPDGAQPRPPVRTIGRNSSPDFAKAGRSESEQKSPERDVLLSLLFIPLWGKREDNWSNFLCILSAERTHIFASIASAPGLRRFPPFPSVSFSPLPISSQEVTNFRHFTKEKWTEKENSAKKLNQSLHQSIRC